MRLTSRRLRSGVGGGASGRGDGCRISAVFSEALRGSCARQFRPESGVRAARWTRRVALERLRHEL